MKTDTGSPVSADEHDHGGQPCDPSEEAGLRDMIEAEFGDTYHVGWLERLTATNASVPTERPRQSTEVKSGEELVPLKPPHSTTLDTAKEFDRQLNALAVVVRKARLRSWWWTGYGTDRINIVEIPEAGEPRQPLRVIATMNGTSRQAGRDSDALLRAVNAVPALIAEVRRLRRLERRLSKKDFLR